MNAERSPHPSDLGLRAAKSLGGQLRVLVILIAALFGLGALAVASLVAGEATSAEFERHARGLTQQLARNISFGVLTQDPEAIHPPLRLALQETDAVGAVVLDVDATLLVDLGRHPELARDAPPLEAPDQVLHDEPDFIVVIQPLHVHPLGAEALLAPSGAATAAPPPERVGSLVLWYSRAALDQALTRTRVVAAALSLLLATVLGLGAAALSARLTRPLEVLTRGLRGLDLREPLGRSQLLEPHADDSPEIEGLKRAFENALNRVDEQVAALERSEERFRSLFDVSGDGLFVIDRHGLVVSANPRSRSWMGVEIGAPLETMIHPGDLVRPVVEHALRAGEARIDDAFVSAPGEEPRAGELSVRRLPLAGEPIALVIFHDRTEARRMARYEATHQEELRQAQKLEALGVLASGIAHDFNNQLSVIVGNLALFRQDLHEDPSLFGGTDLVLSLEDIEESTRLCVELTRRLVSFAKPKPLEVALISLPDLIDETIRMIRRTFPISIQIEKSIETNRSRILADRTQIQQVLMNLCLNARDAMADGGVLQVGCKSCRASAPDQRAPSDFAVLTVVDDGKGMDAETLARIFDPFFTTKERHFGAGLGLASCLRIARAHGGWIDVRSRPGQGARFEVYLPAALERPEERRAEDLGREPVPRAAAIELGDIRSALVVDDDPGLRRLIRSLLQRIGITVREATTAEDAERIYRDPGARTDLIILDVVMPGMGGGALVRRLRAAGDPVPILLTTALTELSEVEALVHDCGVGLLPKPWEPGDLLTILGELWISRTVATPTIDDKDGT